MELSALLPLFTFQFMLVFARLGTAVFVFPAMSDPSVTPRFRLLIALSVSFILYPILAARLPSLPPGTGAMLALLGGEMLIGLMMGLGARLLMAIMSVAGEMIAFMSGFQAATLFDPQSGASTAAPTVLLTLAAGLLVLVLNLHHTLIMGIVESYRALPPGNWLPTADMAQAITRTLGTVFTVGIQIAAPVMVSGFLAYLMFGIFNRLIPQLQVFFLSVPLSIALSLVVMAACLTLMFGLFTNTLQDNLFLLDMEAE
jgi:flagellar biosynthetic protein FliR